MSEPDRVIDLEEKHLYLERQVETLDGLVRDLSGDLEQMRREIESIRSLVQTALTRTPEEDEASPDS
jgi:prefoldin subunit 5